MGKKCCAYMRLKACALGVSFGVLSGVMMMLFAFSAWKWGFATALVQQWGTVYPGFDASLKGGLVGLAWGFLEGFIFGLLLGWIYNLCLCCCSRCPKCCSKTIDSECGDANSCGPKSK